MFNCEYYGIEAKARFNELTSTLNVEELIEENISLKSEIKQLKEDMERVKIVLQAITFSELSRKSDVRNNAV